jgi:hypothetical protein
MTPAGADKKISIFHHSIHSKAFLIALQKA